MAGIPIISNFDVNSYSPIDSRMVVANAAARTSISYLYDGLKVYQTDTKTTWVYKESLGWFIDGNGIYGGNGNLIQNTNVNTGNISPFVGSTTYDFNLYTNDGNENIYYKTQFYNHTPGGTDWPTIEIRTGYWQDNPTLTSVSYISYNAQDWFGTSRNGNIDFIANNSKTITISQNQFIIWGLTYAATILPTALTSSYTYNLPNKGGTFAMVSDLSIINQQFTSNGLTFGSVGITSTNVGSPYFNVGYQVSQNMINLCGAISVSISGSGTYTLLTLPIAPTNQVVINPKNTLLTLTGLIIVTTGGSIQFSCTGSGTGTVYLDGVSYRIY